MPVCDICGTTVKTPQGLSGHYRFRHGEPIGNVRKVEGQTQAEREYEWHQEANDELKAELSEINHKLTLIQLSLDAMMASIRRHP